MKTTIVFLLIFLSTEAMGDGFNHECPRSEQILFFSNGMFNSKKDAQYSLKVLQQKTNNSFFDYKLAYNENESIIMQIFETVFKKIDDGERFLWSYFSRMNGPEWFGALAKKVAEGVTKNTYVLDPDLRRHVKVYKYYLSLNKEILTVAHSQGNFYANEGYEMLSTENKDLRFKIVAVATPSYYVAGNGDYITLKSDGIIALVPGSLPPNTINENAGLLDHELIKHYLGGSSSGPKIMGMILHPQKTMPRYYDDPGYVHKSLVAIRDWTKSLDKKRDRKLSKAQCLAAAIFLKVENWWGIDCTERNFELVEKHARLCFEEEWSLPKEKRLWYDCMLAGLPRRGLGGLKAPLTPREEKIAKMFSECRWSVDDMGLTITEKLMDEAILWIKNPTEAH